MLAKKITLIVLVVLLLSAGLGGSRAQACMQCTAGSIAWGEGYSICVVAQADGSCEYCEVTPDPCPKRPLQQ